MPARLIRAFAAAVFLLFAAFSFAEDSPYCVTWTSPSSGWNETMPLGNGEVAVNAYFNGSAGRLHLLLARTDSWDELGRLAKLSETCVDGLAPLAAGAPYSQTLDARTGEITIVYGAPNAETRIRLWVETDRPVVEVEIESDAEISPRAFFYIWRGEDAGSIPSEVSDLFWAEKTAEIRPDAFATAEELGGGSETIAVYHRNVPTPYYSEIGKAQGLDDWPGRADPFVNRAFGTLVYCKGGKRLEDGSLVAPKGTRARFAAVAYTLPGSDSAQEWIDGASAAAAAAEKESIEVRREKRLAYWRAFTERSWVVFTANKNALPDGEKLEDVEREAFAVSQAYALQRFIFGCEGRGTYPIKFNGGLFTTAPVAGAPGRHDYRKWGPGYWWQNTRLPYYGMLESGDFELMKPLFDMYCGFVPMYEYRVKKYFGDSFEGCYFPECIYFWGDVFPESYGLEPWNSPNRPDPLQTSGYHKWEWVGGLELLFLALEYYKFTGDETFLKEKAVPTALSVVKFFNLYYKTDPESGKLVMSPGQALETWWDCDNPAPEIGGLRAVLQRLLDLPEGRLSDKDRKFCEAMLAKTPELPKEPDAETGEPKLAPAARYANNRNIESPELYAVFPFRLYSFDQPNAREAELAMKTRITPGSYGWLQNDLFYAYLGDRENTRTSLAERAVKKDPAMRFPVFWGPNYDWTPDQTHGGVLCAAVQSAILQTNGKKIFFSPACPKEWNAEFKLYAPEQTVVEGRITDGEIVVLKVTPESRRADVVVVK